MSRDMMPFEAYSLRKAYPNLSWRNQNGKSIIFDHPGQKRYPELAFLLPGYDGLYESISDNEEALEFLDRIEHIVKDIEAGFEKYYETRDLRGTMPQTAGIDEYYQPVVDWFKGKKSHERFCDFISHEIGIMEG